MLSIDNANTKVSIAGRAIPYVCGNNCHAVMIFQIVIHINGIVLGGVTIAVTI